MTYEIHAEGKVAALRSHIAALEQQLADTLKEREYFKLLSEGWSDAEAREDIWPAYQQQGSV